VEEGMRRSQDERLATERVGLVMVVEEGGAWGRKRTSAKAVRATGTGTGERALRM
jgi:hypothetical protein